jgi:aminopeptidase N
MAHQWWGNGVTNRSWRHFWLNEGIATFMTAAYMEHRFGKDMYLRQIDAARVKYHAVRDAGQDKSLVFPNWDSPTPADRSLVYDKGALVLHELRSLLGEDAFWMGLKFIRKGTGASQWKRPTLCAQWKTQVIGTSPPFLNRGSMPNSLCIDPSYF